MANKHDEHKPTGFFADVFQTRYREVTLSALLFAIVIGIVMNAAITYAGLKIGFTLSGSAIAAVLGFGVLRGVLRPLFALFFSRRGTRGLPGSITETNIAQTIASAVNTSNSGIIFTVPVLFLIGYQLSLSDADFWLLTLAAIAGGFMGTAFIIPLRKQMLDIERLRFPSPTAVASILKSPGAGASKAVVLLVGCAIGALIFFPTQLPNLPALGGVGLSHLPLVGTANGGFIGDGTINLGALLGLPEYFQLVFAIAPFALGAGYLTGRPGLLVLAGGILAYFILNPFVYLMGWMPATLTEAQVPDYAFNAFNRPLGIGLLLGGALMGVIASMPAVREAIKSIAAAGRVKGGGDELGLKTLVVVVLLGVVALYFTADLIGNRPVNTQGVDPVTNESIEQVVETRTYNGYTIAFNSVDTAEQWSQWSDQQRDAYMQQIHAKPGWFAGLNPHLRALLIALIGAIWIWFAGIIIAQCTGMTDWSPISGLALLTVVLVLILAGTGAVLGAVLLGVALCVAITLAADMMGDMKTGYLVGSKPKRQQVTELMVVWIGPIICMLTLMLIVTANMETQGAPLGPETDTPAPQAQALEAVIIGVQGGEMPYALYGFGAMLGGLLGLGAFSGLGVLIGLSMYLPFIYISTYGVGCIVQMIIVKTKGKVWAEDWGVPFCAGLIVGESVLAIIINAYLVLSS